jgi:hypothetical protein
MVFKMTDKRQRVKEEQQKLRAYSGQRRSRTLHRRDGQEEATPRLLRSLNFPAASDIGKRAASIHA